MAMPDSSKSTAASAGFGFARIAGSGMNALMDRTTGIAAADDARAELAELLRRVGGHDAAALRSLYDRTSAKLYGICLRLLGTESEALDVLQEVYVTVWSKASRFDVAKASAITWLSVLTRNKAIDFARARRAPPDELDAAADVVDESPSALDVLEHAQDATRLQNCLDELDERARTMIRSAFFEGATYPELAKREGVPLPTMKSWVRRGLLRLRGCLER